MRKLMTLSLLALAVLPLHAEVYQWTDAQGQVHFGDRPPANADARERQIESPRRLNGAGEDSAARIRELDEFFRRRQDERRAEEQAAAKREAASEKRDEACRRMLAELRHMKTINRFYRLNDQGETVFLSGEEGDRLRRNYRQSYEEHCGDR
ncbi:DUF4124 domain-containing protein [Marinobacter halodurans]|nr:DUF4124 domain-containing protein [Marinobacter halodurans]